MFRHASSIFAVDRSHYRLVQITSHFFGNCTPGRSQKLPLILLKNLKNLKSWS